MLKISQYLYPNRVILLADLAAFNVEFTNVYQRTVKIYNGIDNTIEFDIKNADQKRIDLTTLVGIEMNVMDASGNALPNSPYTITPTALKGIATVTIPQEDLVDLTDQYLRYSVTAIKDGKDVLLYADTKFGGAGTIELIGDAMPTIRDERTYDTFTSEVDLRGVPIHHSSAIPTRFYEAVPTATISLDIYVTGFVGSIWVDATKRGGISHEAFKEAGKPFGSWTQVAADGKYTGIIPFGQNLPVGDYTYFRVSYQAPSVNGLGAAFTIAKTEGSYSVALRQGGTGYSLGSMIRVPGSQLGGTDGDNDLFITVTGLDTAGAGTIPSSYAVSSITSVSWTGTGSNGSGTYVVSGVNYSGIVDKIVVS